MIDSGLRYASVTDLLYAWSVSEGAELGLAPNGLSTELPDGYKKALPRVRVTRLGGSRRYGIDNAQVRFEVFASSYDSAEKLANRLDAAVEGSLSGFGDDSIGRVMVTEVRQGAVFAQWDDPQVARFMSTYLIQVGA